MSKLYDHKFVKVSREQYGQLRLLADWLVFKAGGKVELPTVREMQLDLSEMSSAVVPHGDGTATAMIRKAENGPAS